MTHLRTGEQVGLPFSEAARPFLVFDEEGFGCVTSEVGTEPLLVDELLHEKVFPDPDGTTTITIDETGGISTHASLGALESLWQLATLSAHMGPLRGEVALDMAIFSRQRGGCRCWWAILSIYNGLGLTFKVQWASVWLHERLPKWADLLKRLQADGHILQSKPYEDAACGDRQRLLPFVSMSSVALVGLVSAWAWGSKCRCGMQQEENSERAAIAIDYLVNLASGREWELHMFAGETFVAQ